ncbi:hypothetical protein EJ05DRAFT_479544 [Pseudovirgaria hyperparasitica]|uniref:Uncharacterized protein n=1 Tax=Pseudovirgaria hyperparasitica TaxID=470096 RepID=A0A6A6VXP5_9PEZI|nr:uncharacterized protein EJ05DRAFT_479544 [Pseudovirgaria hyperparasitica]KAF2754576.1 hypothetical protein EJ05DRAFT_479544 [Pseudovirgaria hyperparasitica]
MTAAGGGPSIHPSTVSIPSTPQLPPNPRPSPSPLTTHSPTKPNWPIISSQLTRAPQSSLSFVFSFPDAPIANSPAEHSHTFAPRWLRVPRPDQVTVVSGEREKKES